MRLRILTIDDACRPAVGIVLSGYPDGLALFVALWRWRVTIIIGGRPQQ